MEEIEDIVGFYTNFPFHEYGYVILRDQKALAPMLSCASPPALHSFLKVLGVVGLGGHVDNDRLTDVMELQPAIVTPSLATLLCSLAAGKKVRRVAFCFLALHCILIGAVAAAAAGAVWVQ